MEKLMLSTVVLLIMVRSSHCQCSNAKPAFRENLRTLLNLLTKNAPLHDGFYNAIVGNMSDQAFGVLHCKANISKNDCANCLNYPFGILDDCPYSSDKETLTSTCTMKLSHKNFFGVWSNFSIADSANSALDDPLVFSKGFSMMQDLASTVPDQPLMFATAVFDAGVGVGKRYGLAQCGRDLSKQNCRNCLEDRLQSFRPYVENRTRWEILGVGCSMWYSNNSTLDVRTSSQSQFPPTADISGVQKWRGEIGVTTIISMSFTTFTVLLVTQVFRF